ncbi:hypothetical protein HZH68_004043 [Vespula germanica]|uniref:Uncharacterized protein n=1 Tax=Vespula germanica TaxID=30212 RepID=A0A834KPH0_VESGE|nr:hypothetical protein HZH68_004043 [Vespula germanica]
MNKTKENKTETEINQRVQFEYRIDDKKKEKKKENKKEKGQISKEGSRTSYRSRLSIVGEATIWTPPSEFRVKLQRGGYQSNSNEQATLRPERL